LPYFVERRLAMLQGKPKQSDTRLNQYKANDAIGELEKKILDRVWGHMISPTEVKIEWDGEYEI